MKNQEEHSGRVDFDAIIHTPVSYLHLIPRLVFTLLLPGLMMYLILPVTFWSLFGSGSTASRIIELPVSRLIYQFGPLLTALIFLLWRWLRNYRKRRLVKLKSYLIILFVLFAFYPFRHAILTYVISLIIG